MIHDNFPGHYTAYKTYYIIIIIVAIIATSCNETFRKSICTFHTVVLSFLKQTCLEAVEVIYFVFASRRRYMHDNRLSNLTFKQIEVTCVLIMVNCFQCSIIDKTLYLWAKISSNCL